jgi:hypothetical protein
MGDAFGVGMLTSVNDDLYREGLTHIDRRTIGDGDSNASTWTEWAFSPIRFEGMTKHSMASSLRAVFHNRQAAISSFDDDADALNGSSNNGSTSRILNGPMRAERSVLIQPTGNCLCGSWAT